jgi:uncharacterized protein
LLKPGRPGRRTVFLNAFMRRFLSGEYGTVMMNETHAIKISEELGISVRQVTAAAALLEEGATVPFIARYRKEATGSLDEVAVTAVRDRMEQLIELDKRREAIVKSLLERDLLTDELKEKIAAASTMAVLEDIYLPYRPKRRTRAMIAREKGLEPLARMLFDQEEGDPAAWAGSFVDEEKGVGSAEEALSGARDIIAEWINEDQTARAEMRTLFSSKGSMKSRVIPGKEEEGKKYRDYFEWEEPVVSAPSHRVLAMRRGEKEEFLSLSVLPPEAEAIIILERLFIKKDNPAAREVRAALNDSYARLLAPSMETEIRMASKKRADEQAIAVFAGNLRELLMAAPLGQKTILAVDPGIRTGCKTVCLDQQGKLIHHETVYPLLSQSERAKAGERILDLCRTYAVEAIAVGNGTGGRETESFLRGLGLPPTIQIVLVNESGASIYSASKIARDEFPDHDVTVRGAVSIGRRLMDPLAELVKIDPKSIGVGQYQHDVDQTLLKRSLDDVVMSCVNAVGVEVNTASAQLLTYVSGLGPQLAKNIIAFRNEHGPFAAREELKRVPRLGEKAFEQAGGFLRIRGGADPLDESAVHPESYPVVEAMAADLGCTVSDLLRDAALRERIDINKYVTEKTGLPTLNDILKELAKPGRDPRSSFEQFAFAEGVEKLEDLTAGMKLPGIVTNVTAFGAFVDIGVHQDGLVHMSELSDHYVSDPNRVVKVHQKVQVTVLSVDLDRKRISLSMKKDPKSREKKIEAPRPAVHRKSDKKKKEKDPIPFNNPFAKAFKKN